MKHAVVAAWVGALALGGLAAGLAKAEEELLPPDAEIERAVRTVWLNGGNRVPLCAALSGLRPDQQGSQELQQVFAPGQWVVRLAQVPQPRADIAQLDHLAKFGLLERRDEFVNIGPIQALPAVEYRPTLAGWAQSVSRGEAAAYPCFYFGMAQALKVVGYSESARDQDGFSRVAIYFLVGADAVEPWASTQEAVDLFPALTQGRKGRFDLHRGPDGKLRIARAEPKSIDETIPPHYPAVLPGIALALEGIEQTRSLANPDPGLAWPPACFALLSRTMPQLWKSGDAEAAAQAILRIPQARDSGRELAVLAHARLKRLEQAGLVAVRGDAESGQVTVHAAQKIRPLLARHGNCLPLGKVRIEVAGVLRDDVPGERQRFKARYLVEEPAAWIKEVRNTALLPDLAAILRHGQPFEGATVKTRDGWTAADLEDRRPLPTFASLTSVGVSPDWQNTTETTIAAASVLNHELHVVEAYAAPTGRIDVLVKSRPRPLLVVLRGYEPIEWHLRLERGANVAAVLAVGYHEQRITGLPATTAAVTAHAPDGVARGPATTLIGKLDRRALGSLLGVTPTSVQAAEGGQAVVGAR
jgi:hypothetical protein